MSVVISVDEVILSLVKLEICLEDYIQNNSLAFKSVCERLLQNQHDEKLSKYLKSQQHLQNAKASKAVLNENSPSLGWRRNVLHVEASHNLDSLSCKESLSKEPVEVVCSKINGAIHPSQKHNPEEEDGDKADDMAGASIRTNKGTTSGMKAMDELAVDGSWSNTSVVAETIDYLWKFKRSERVCAFESITSDKSTPEEKSFCLKRCKRAASPVKSAAVG
ncbi:Phospholipase A I [Camellia lanceoleosa]|uniref:Phospholipase A I n=1 Tax=Camellia lanceoleosa TaxID=1840588 RepID=A0ACC0GI76_9ERIC|nr:Phospholipase A I [Camellia lanceoleosa]